MKKNEIERKLVTILSADVAEYSRLMAEDEEQTLTVFREHKEIFESLVELHRGRIFNTAGDAILAEFNSAVEAVRCATEIQSALRTRNDKLPKQREVRFRIGVNLGDVIVQGTDLLGDGVNIAARLQAAAEPGGVCISGSVFDQIQNKLSLAVENMGEKNFKNIPHSVRTFSIRETEGHKPLPIAKPAAPKADKLGIYVAAAMLLLLVGVGASLLYLSRKESAPGTGASAQAVKETPPIAIPEKIERKFETIAGAGEAKWLVDAENGPGSTGTTIAGAIAVASPGDVIEIRPGIYREHVTIERDVVLRGVAAADGNIGVRIEFTGVDTIDVVAGLARLENIQIVLIPSAGAVSPAAILVRGGFLELHNVVSLTGGGVPATALSIRDGEATIKNSSFTGSRGIEQLAGKLLCENCEADGNREEGAVILNQSGKVGFSSVFKGFHARRNGLNGLAVMDGTEVQVDGCMVAENGVNGVLVNGTGKVKFTKCEIWKNKENGFVATDEAQLEIVDSKMSRNGYSGYASLGQASAVIRRSELQGNGEFGFAVMENSVVKSEANEISGNRGGASYRAPASAPVPQKGP